MKIIQEMALNEFDFWDEGQQNADLLTEHEFKVIEDKLEARFPDGLEERQLNDIFWFEEDMLANWLGYPDWETLSQERQPLQAQLPYGMER